MSRREYEASLKGLEEARTAAIKALEADVESKGAIEEIVAYSTLIAKAKKELEELPPDPPVMPTGALQMISGRRACWSDFKTNKWSSGLIPPKVYRYSDTKTQSARGASIRSSESSESLVARNDIHGERVGVIMIDGHKTIYSVGGALGECDDNYTAVDGIHIADPQSISWRILKRKILRPDREITAASAIGDVLYIADANSTAAIDGDELDVQIRAFSTSTRSWTVIECNAPSEITHMFRDGDCIITVGNDIEDTSVGMITGMCWKAMPSMSFPYKVYGNVSYYDAV